MGGINHNKLVAYDIVLTTLIIFRIWNHLLFFWIIQSHAHICWFCSSLFRTRFSYWFNLCPFYSVPCFYFCSWYFQLSVFRALVCWTFLQFSVFKLNLNASMKHLNMIKPFNPCETDFNHTFVGLNDFKWVCLKIGYPKSTSKSSFSNKKQFGGYAGDSPFVDTPEIISSWLYVTLSHYISSFLAYDCQFTSILVG